MDEVLLKQLVRQMKILNFWVTCFGTLFLISLLIMGYLLFKIITFVHKTEQSITNFQQQTSQALDVQSKVCGTDSLRAILNKTGDYCK